MSAQYNANQDVKVVRRYFVGTTTLAKGQILHYQEDASKTNADPKLRLGSAVEVVDSDNVKYFAGVVGEQDAGQVGPCFVTLQVPQSTDVIDAQVNGATDVAAGDLLEPDATKGCLIKATAAAGDNLFVSFEATTTDDKVVLRIQKV